MIAAMTLRERCRVEPGTEGTIGLPHEVETASNYRRDRAARLGNSPASQNTAVAKVGV